MSPGRYRWVVPSWLVYTSVWYLVGEDEWLAATETRVDVLRRREAQRGRRVRTGREGRHRRHGDQREPPNPRPCRPRRHEFLPPGDCGSPRGGRLAQDS